MHICKVINAILKSEEYINLQAIKKRYEYWDIIKGEKIERYMIRARAEWVEEGKNHR